MICQIPHNECSPAKTQIRGPKHFTRKALTLITLRFCLYRSIKNYFHTQCIKKYFYIFNIHNGTLNLALMSFYFYKSYQRIIKQRLYMNIKFIPMKTQQHTCILLPRPLSNDARFIQCIYPYSHASKRFVEVYLNTCQ